MHQALQVSRITIICNSEGRLVYGIACISCADKIASLISQGLIWNRWILGAKISVFLEKPRIHCQERQIVIHWLRDSKHERQPWPRLLWGEKGDDQGRRSRTLIPTTTENWLQQSPKEALLYGWDSQKVTCITGSWAVWCKESSANQGECGHEVGSD